MTPHPYKAEALKDSQNKQVLDWLKSGQTLTQFQAASYFGIYRLGARIYDLHKQGHAIKSELQFDGSKHCSLYSLEITLP
jgi:hypothetical protein